VVVLPLLGAFLLMVTALTYQFQGWLAVLMSNPRRRRAIVVGMTTLIVLISQLPNLLNFYAPWSGRQQMAHDRALRGEKAQLDRAYKAGQLDAKEYARRLKEARGRQKLDLEEVYRRRAARWGQIARGANVVLPVGWLPLGVMSAAEGHPWPALLGLLGMSLIGTISLWRAYRTTVGQCQGEASNTKVRAAVAPRLEREPGGLLLEARIPGFSEPVSAVALAGFRSLLRSPEVKMAMLTPLIMGAIFGSMMVGKAQTLPESLRPLTAIGAIAFGLLGVLQLAGNQFGFDRDGFRVFVLCAAPRRDILLGKSLAYAPLGLGMSALLAAVVQFFCPMRRDHLLAMVPQIVSMFLMFCLLTSLMSIYAPIGLAAGSLKPSNLKVTTVLVQQAMVFLVFPLCEGVTLLPLGAEALLRLLGRAESVPVFLLMSLVECGVIVVLYNFALSGLGRLLQEREQAILEVVTHRAA
jgi:hypothetical protein